MPAYRLYRCGDGRSVALGALEPKFWRGFLELLELPGLDGAGLDAGPTGAAAARAVERRLAERPAADWLRRAEAAGLPLAPVNGVAEGAADPCCAEGTLFPALPGARAGSAPAPGADTRRLLRGAGLSDAEIARLRAG